MFKFIFCASFIWIFSLTANAWQPLINGGEAVAPSDAIAKSTVMLETDAQYCSATIIANDTLLTAAHCLGENEPWIMIHFAGLEGNLSRKASGSIRHEHYQDLQTTTRNDVALVFFTGGLPTGFNSVAILAPEQAIKVGDEMQIAGYGQGGPQGSLATIKLKITEFLFAESLIKFTQTTKLGVCHGDSGGPAFKNINGQLFLAGVASYTEEGDCSGFSVYTKATPFIDWISKQNLSN